MIWLPAPLLSPNPALQTDERRTSVWFIQKVFAPLAAERQIVMRPVPGGWLEHG